jgi:hypothetical protein
MENFGADVLTGGGGWVSVKKGKIRTAAVHLTRQNWKRDFLMKNAENSACFLFVSISAGIEKM